MMLRILALLLCLVATPVLAQTTWNPADKSGNVVLSNGNLTTGPSISSTAGGVRGTTSHSTGKWYFEFTLGVNSASSEHSSGIGSASATFGNYVGFDNNAVGCVRSASVIKLNNVSVATGVTCANFSGEVFELAVDLTAKLVWMRKKGSTWNGNASADPATGVGGVDISTMASLTVFPMWVDNGTTDTGTANFGASAFSDTVPTGFSAWGGSAVVIGPSLSQFPLLGQ